ncbi:hypothetical protein ACIBCR_31595 [Micromonospora echinospora]|uniref:hypothetical protein n=1 Tax=Micromonospora echinospora TaxID=1877 RepID=UPI0037B0F9A0
MADAPATPPHDAIPYTECGYGPVDAFTVVDDANGLDLTGACPACNGPTTSRYEIGSPHGYKGIFPTRKPVAPPKPTGLVTVICACGYPHAERPAESGESGCGAYWKVRLP